MGPSDWESILYALIHMEYIVKKEPDSDHNELELHCLSRGGVFTRFCFVMMSSCDFIAISHLCDFVVESPSCDFVVVSPSCDFCCGIGFMRFRCGTTFVRFRCGTTFVRFRCGIGFVQFWFQTVAF
jgi:hypothetical protein